MAVCRDDVHAEILRVDLGDLLDVVVPAVDTMVLPLRSGSAFILEAFFAIQRLVRKWVIVNHLFLPVGLLVVDRTRGRSCRSPLRDSVRGSDELVLTSSFGIFSSFLTRIDDAQAQVDRVADRLLLVVVIGEQESRRHGARW